MKKDELESLINEQNLVSIEQPSIMLDLRYLEVELGIEVNIIVEDDGKTICYSVDKDNFLGEKVDSLDVYKLLTHQWYFENGSLKYKINK